MDRRLAVAPADVRALTHAPLTRVRAQPPPAPAGGRSSTRSAEFAASSAARSPTRQKSSTRARSNLMIPCTTRRVLTTRARPCCSTWTRAGGCCSTRSSCVDYRAASGMSTASWWPRCRRASRRRGHRCAACATGCACASTVCTAIASTVVVASARRGRHWRASSRLLLPVSAQCRARMQSVRVGQIASDPPAPARSAPPVPFAAVRSFVDAPTTRSQMRADDRPA